MMDKEGSNNSDRKVSRVQFMESTQEKYRHTPEHVFLHSIDHKKNKENMQINTTLLCTFKKLDMEEGKESKHETTSISTSPIKQEEKHPLARLVDAQRAQTTDECTNALVGPRELENRPE
jgi:phenylalanyl-tRNA synthetase alpha subunit